MKRALVTGITGQDGAYLAEFLLAKGYEVHGIKRRASLFNTQRVDHIYEDPHVEHQNFVLHYGDLTDSSNLTRILQEVQPDEVYNLGAQSHVAVSFEAPEYTADVDAIGTLRLLEAIRFLGMEKKTRFYQASTSELYGLVQEIPQKETTPFYPRSPYAVAKLYAYWITVNYRESYGLYACNGILFNHESPRRGETFVTRKITRGLSNIAQGLESCLYMGNLDSLRDWGHAKDYVRMQWMMLQQDQPDDYVIATGFLGTLVGQAIVVRLPERTFRLAFLVVAVPGEGSFDVGGAIFRHLAPVLVDLQVVCDLVQPGAELRVGAPALAGADHPRPDLLVDLVHGGTVGQATQQEAVQATAVARVQDIERRGVAAAVGLGQCCHFEPGQRGSCIANGHRVLLDGVPACGAPEAVRGGRGHELANRREPACQARMRFLSSSKIRFAPGSSPGDSALIVPMIPKISP